MSAECASGDRAHVRAFTKRSRSNFYYSFLFLPPEQREAIEALYAFCRSVDDAVDGAPGVAAGRAELERWRRELAACFDGGTPEHPITRALAVQVRRFDLSRDPLEEVIRGVEMDLTERRYETFEDLALYCRRVASAVGHSCIEIFGSRGEASRRYATTLGLAFQLTNIIRDLCSDCRRGRLYFPAEEVARFGYSAEAAAAGRAGPGFAPLMEFQCRRAREHFERARRELPDGEGRRLLAATIMGGIYRQVLEKIARRPQAVLEKRVSLSRACRMTIAAGIYARARWAR